MTPSPRLHPEVTEILDALRRIIRELRQSSRLTERRFGIGSAQLFVLQQLADAPADSVNELADRTYTHQSSVSVVVRRLVEQKLVVRRAASADRRRRELRLTAAGRRVVTRAPVPAQVRLIQALLTLSPPQLRSLEALLKRLVRTMGASGTPAEMLFVDEPRPKDDGHSPRSMPRRQLPQNTSRGRRSTRPATPRR
jgi:MarR family transcriptional regulator, lower aerobic nicotinate degradation pathway regulator